MCTIINLIRIGEKHQCFNMQYIISAKRIDFYEWTMVYPTETPPLRVVHGVLIERATVWVTRGMFHSALTTELSHYPIVLYSLSYPAIP